jgi:hypothetical protein
VKPKVQTVAMGMDGDLQLQVEPTTGGKFKGRWFLRLQQWVRDPAGDPEDPPEPVTLMVGPLSKAERIGFIRALGGQPRNGDEL